MEGAEVVPGTVVGPRGFSLRELGLTLLLLGVVIAAAVRFIDLRTRLLVVEKDEPLGSVLEAAARSLARDVRDAGRGGLPAGDAVRLVADNTDADRGAALTDVKGASVAVRAGTDQLGLRGVMRTPLLALGPARGAGRTDPSSVWLAAGAFSGGGEGGRKDDPRAVAERLAMPRAKRFFLVADRDGRTAVAFVRGWTPPREAGAPIEIRLDFTDPEAARLGGGADAARSLGEPVTGGLLDDVVWFVAEGAPGRSPDYDPVNDPPSMKFPHPFLAVAEFAGNGRWEVARVGDDVEELQLALEPGALRVAWTAKAERRFTRSDGPPPPSGLPRLLNAPAPGSAREAGPVGWDPDESRRIPFERASREFVLPLGGPDPPGPRGAAGRVK